MKAPERLVLSDYKSRLQFASFADLDRGTVATSAYKHANGVLPSLPLDLANCSDLAALRHHCGLATDVTSRSCMTKPVNSVVSKLTENQLMIWFICTLFTLFSIKTRVYM